MRLGENPHLLHLRLPYSDKSIDGNVAVNAGFGMNYLTNLDANKTVGRKQADGKLYSIVSQVLTQQQCISLKKKKISNARFCAKAVKNEFGEATGTCNVSKFILIIIFEIKEVGAIGWVIIVNPYSTLQLSFVDTH